MFVRNQYLLVFALFFVLNLFVFSTPSSAQAQRVLDSLELEEAFYSRDGYKQEAFDVGTGAIQTLSPATFNQGLISDPFLLLQGKVPGVQIYNRGGDPNAQSLMRIRGLSGIAQQRQALLVVDGIPGLRLENIDPLDIESITVLKDAATQAMYGIRGANGVLLINTKAATYTRDTMLIRYNGQLASSSLFAQDPVFSPDEYRALGGFDLGASNNWLEEISRTGISQVHALALERKKGSTSFRISGVYRDVEGILRHSRFEKYNFRLALKTSLKEKLNLRIHSAYSNRSSQFGFREAFKYSSSFNPTAPISGRDVPFPFNGDQFGGYYENIGLFDSYNPLAMVDLNDRFGLEEVLTSTAHLQYLVGTELNINFRYSYQDLFRNQRTFYAPTSLFRGGAYFTPFEDRGQAILKDVDDRFSLYELYLNANKTVGATSFAFTVGASYQDGRYFEDYLQLGGFQEEADLEARRIGDLQGWTERSTSFDTIRNGWNDLLASVFTRVNANWKNKVFLDATLRYEGASKLGVENQYGLFPALAMTFDVGEIWAKQSLERFHFRIAYGSTGGLPAEGGLAQRQIELVEQQDGSFESRDRRLENPELGWEKKNEISLGFDLRQGKFAASVDWYSRNLKDWIRFDPSAFPERYTNQNSMRSTGLELNVQLQLYETSKAKLAMGLLLSTYRSRLSDLEFEPQLVTSPGGFIQNPLIVLLNGASPGRIYGAEFSGNIDENGFPLFEDVNGDGSVVTFPSLFDLDDDFVDLGTGIPRFELGWNTHWHYQGWDLLLFFRGAFGHVLVNRTRQFLEPQPNNVPIVSNFVSTDLAVNNLSFSTYSSLYVEQADFLKLDHISIAKSWSLSQQRAVKQLTIRLTGQNLLVFSNYTGTDPEPALEDIGTLIFEGESFPAVSSNPLAAGIDRRHSYRPSRTVVLGLELCF